jgi:hypothetical protein
MLNDVILDLSFYDHPEKSLLWNRPAPVPQMPQPMDHGDSEVLEVLSPAEVEMLLNMMSDEPKPDSEDDGGRGEVERLLSMMGGSPAGESDGVV